MSSGIYKITNTINDKCYIGLSKNIENRQRQHMEGFKNFNYNPKSEKRLYWAAKEYGVDKFIFEIIEYCDIDELGKRENYWIKHYDSFENGYNSSWGGEGAEFDSIEDKYNIGKFFNFNINFLSIFSNDSNKFKPYSIKYNNDLINYYEKKILKKPKKKDKYQYIININKTIIELKKEDEILLKELEKQSKIRIGLNQKIHNQKEKIYLINFKTLNKNIQSTKLGDYFIVRGPIIDSITFQRDNVKYKKVSVYEGSTDLTINYKGISIKNMKNKGQKINFTDLKSINVFHSDQYITIIINENNLNFWSSLNRTFRSSDPIPKTDGFYFKIPISEEKKARDIVYRIRKEIKI